MKPWFRTFFNPYLLLLLTLSCLALTPLAAPGYFYDAHDGRHSVFYLIMFDASIQDGALWPRWAMHHLQGYGYPTFIIQAPLGFYIAEFFILLGAGYTLAAKLTWMFGFLTGAAGIYYLLLYWLCEAKIQAPYEAPHKEVEAREQLAHLCAVFAGLLYVFIPYHLVDIYVRAALNDTLLFAWFPWVFLAFDRLLTRGRTSGWQRRLIIALFCMAATLLTHTFALISFAPLVVTFVLLLLWQTWRYPVKAGKSGTRLTEITLHSWQTIVVPRFLLATVAGFGVLLLCANFILPLLLEGPHLDNQVYTTSTYDFRRHFVYFGQFITPYWGYGFSDDPTGVNDGMPFELGLMASVPLLVTLYLLFDWASGSAAAVKAEDEEEGNQTKRIMSTMTYLTVVTFVLLYTMTPAARSLWEILTPLAVIQFPWRLLSLTAFTVSALSGLTLWNLLLGWKKRMNQNAFPRQWSEQASGGLILGILVIFASYQYVAARLEPVEPWREDGRAIFRFEQQHPDMIAYTEWVKEPFQESPMTANYAAEGYREDYSEDGLLDRLAIIQGNGKIISQYSRGSSMGGIVTVDGPATVRLNVTYFPGWQVRVNDEKVDHRVSDPYGLVEVDLVPGTHRIDMQMGATRVRRVGTILSYLTLGLVLRLLFWPQRAKDL